MILPDASFEQVEVIYKLNNNNVIVDSVAGSGKTTTILHIAKTFDQNILLLTYNKRLKFETRTKRDLLKLHNLEVHSYHSFCCKYYDRNCYTDVTMISLLKNNKRPHLNLMYDMIILDEAQDVTPLYYELVHKIINNKRPKMCILGDRHQSIFQYNGANEKYIIFADKLFSVNGMPWTKTNLSTSFRLTIQIADFINNVALKNNKLKAIKTGTKPNYIVCDCFKKGKSRPFEEVMTYLKTYDPEDIFVLAPSLKNERNAARYLANELSEHNIAVYVPNTDDESIDDDILKGKIAFCTFHQVKGLERKIVIICNFDNSYFLFYDKKSDPKICPNVLYVAMTRASEHLTLLHNFKDDMLEFLNKDLLRNYSIYEGPDIIENTGNVRKDKNLLKITVTDLVKYLPSNVIDTAMGFIEVINMKRNVNLLPIVSKTKQNDLYENVADITGIAIPIYYELLKKRKSVILDTLVRHKLINREDINITSESSDMSKINIDVLLYISNIYYTHTSGYKHRLKQINDYSWLTYEMMDKCVTRLDSILDDDFEYGIEYSIKGKKELVNDTVFLTGSIDCIDHHNDNVFEFKCTNAIKPEHYLQLAIYQYMHRTRTSELRDNQYNYYLYNILSNEMCEIKSTYDNLCKLVEYLIMNRYFKNDIVDDDQFITNALKLVNKYGVTNVKDKQVIQTTTNKTMIQKPIMNRPIIVNRTDDKRKSDDFSQKWNNGSIEDKLQCYGKVKLMYLAKQKNLKGYSRYGKDQLVNVLIPVTTNDDFPIRINTN